MLGMAHKGLKLRGNRFLVALCALVLNTLGFAQSTDTAKVNHESGVISANYWTLGIEHSSGMSSSAAKAEIKRFNPSFAYSYFHSSRLSMGLTFQVKDITSSGGGTHYRILLLGNSFGYHWRIYHPLYLTLGHKIFL